MIIWGIKDKNNFPEHVFIFYFISLYLLKRDICREAVRYIYISEHVSRLVWKDRQFILFVQSLLWKYQASSLEILRKTSTCVLFRNNRRCPGDLTFFLESKHGILRTMLLSLPIVTYDFYINSTSLIVLDMCMYSTFTFTCSISYKYVYITYIETHPAELRTIYIW